MDGPAGVGMAISGLATALFSQKINRRFGVVASLALLAVPVTAGGLEVGIGGLLQGRTERLDELGAARGEQADWYRNLQKNAGVRLRIGRDWMSGTAEPVTEVSEKAAYLHTRLERHPRMVGRMLRLHGVSGNSQPEDIVRVAAEIALVRVTQIATGA